MWILNWLPDWVFHLILLFGILAMIASYVLRYVPAIRIYRTPIMMAGIFLTVLGVWYEGGIAKDKEYRAAIEEYKHKLEIAKQETELANNKIKTKIVTKTQTIETAGATITEYIDREVVKYNNSCVLPKEAIVAHNAAALSLKIDSNLSTEQISKMIDEHNAAAKNPENKEKRSWLDRLRNP